MKVKGDHFASVKIQNDKDDHRWSILNQTFKYGANDV